MFLKTDVMVEHANQATKLLIKDLLAAFNKKIIEKEREERAEKRQPSADYYPPSQYMHDRIIAFNANAGKNDPLKTVKSQATFLMDFFINCGPGDEEYFTQQEADAIYTKHAAMSSLYTRLAKMNSEAHQRTLSLESDTGFGFS